MCFHVHPDHPTAKIAEKDITCYKVVETVRGNNQYKVKYISLYQGFIYERGKTYFSEISRYYNKIEEGVHSYTNLKTASEYKRYGVVLIECTIPKGSTYYYDPENEEYVSNQIKIIKTI